jgi:hypothetical protein
VEEVQSLCHAGVDGLPPMRDRYWVVGGEYTDMTFDRLVSGSEIVRGPLASRAVAERVWRRLSERHRHKAMMRFSILTETMRDPEQHPGP